MPSLLIRSRTLREDIREITRLRNSSRDASGFHTRAERLEGPTRRLATLMAIADELRVRGVTIDLNIPSVAGLMHAVRSALQSITADYGADPRTILEGD